MRTALLVLVAACAAHEAGPCPECADIDEVIAPTATPDGEPWPLDVAPPTLAASGLCLDEACATLAPDVVAFAPRWTLWSDGAEKQRWIQLPPGAVIDTSNADYWRFPVGTKLWKQFTRDGIRVETRYMAKYGPGDADWLFVPYEWADDESIALPVIDGDANVHGTAHDIPSQHTCQGCHANVHSRVLGFSALQLDYAAPNGLVDLDTAIAAGWLSSAPPRASSPHYPLPGNAQQQATLGYFHANCGHCHNSQSPLINRPMFRLEVDRLSSLAATRTYASTVNVQGTAFGGATIIAKPRDPDHSIIITRMRSTDPKHRMPALGTETLDPTGYSLIRAWISAL